MAGVLQFLTLLMFRRVVKATKTRRLRLWPPEPLLQSYINTTTSAPAISSTFRPESLFFRSSARAIGKGLPWKNGHGFLGFPFSHTTQQHGRSFHLSTHQESKFLLPVPKEKFFIESVLTDYAIVLHDLLDTKKRLEEQNTRVLKVKEFKMRMLFGYPPASSTKVTEGPRHEFRFAIGEKDVDFHAVYDSEEREQLISLCEMPENKPILDSLKVTVEGVRNLVDNLENTRLYFIENYTLEDGTVKTVTE